MYQAVDDDTAIEEKAIPLSNQEKAIVHLGNPSKSRHILAIMRPEGGRRTSHMSPTPSSTALSSSS